VILKDGTAAEFAPVLLLNAIDSVLQKGALCNEKGNFELEKVPAGTYFLSINYVGCQKYESKVFQLTEDIKMESITLQVKEDLLDAVNIVANKPFFEHKIDRMVINVGASSINAGGTALQVLQKSPGVQVNKQTNQLAMSGKNGVIIMINGKISQLPPEAIIAMLDGMSADNIDRIELIHTPPANFDAQGNAGIINIVLKQSPDDGLNGNYMIKTGYGRGAKYGAGFSTNYRSKKWNLYGGYDYNYNFNPHVALNYRGINDENNNFVEADSYSNRRPDLYNQNARIGADYQLTKNTVVGVIGTFFDRNWDMIAVNDVNYLKNSTIYSKLKMTTLELNKWRSYTSNINLVHDFGNDKKLSMDYDYVNYTITNPSSYTNEYLDNNGNVLNADKIRISKETPITINVGKVDYSQNLGKAIKFEIGAKHAFSTFDNDVKVETALTNDWKIDTALTSKFQLFEKVSAGYSSFSWTINSKTEVKIGLRYEYTNTNLGSKNQPNVVDRQYGSWFPTVYVSRKFDENHVINFSYNQRINRPGFTQLAPYLIYFDPTTVNGGNPALQPSFVTSYRGTYSFNGWSLTADYSVTDASIRDFPFIDVKNNRQFNKPENQGTDKMFFLDLSFHYSFTKWWETQNDFYVGYQLSNFIFADKPIEVVTKAAGFNCTQSITLPHKFSIDISANYLTPSYWGIYKYNGNGNLSFGFNKNFGEKWGSLTFNINDIFQSSNWLGTAKDPSVNLNVFNAFKDAERTFMITWSNKFGNKKLKDSRQRARGSDEEMRRL
jgi:hypothetical protein